MIRFKKIFMVILSIVPMFVFFLPKILHFSINIDSEMAIVDNHARLNWLLGMGRYTAYFLNKLLMKNYHYYLSLIYTIFALLLSNIYTMVILKKYNVNNDTFLIFSFNTFTFPTFAELFYFNQSSFVNAIGILLAIIAADVMFDGICNKKIFYVVGGGFLAILSIGAYQGIFYIFLSYLFVVFYFSWGKKCYSKKTFINIIIHIGLCIFIILGGYWIITKLVQKFLYQNDLLYAGFGDAPNYISRQIGWLYGFKDCFRNIFAYIKDTFLSPNGYAFLIYFIFVIIFIITTEKKENFFDRIVDLLFAFGFILMPYTPVIVKGQGITKREQIVFPFMFSFLIIIVINKLNKKYKNILFIACLAIGAFSTMLSFRLFQADYHRFKDDERLVFEIYDDLQNKYGNISNKKIVFLNEHEWENNLNEPIGEVMGHSFFTWDANAEAGVNYRVHAFFSCLDKQYICPALDDINLCKTIDYGDEKIFAVDEDIIVYDLSK